MPPRSRLCAKAIRPSIAAGFVGWGIWRSERAGFGRFLPGAASTPPAAAAARQPAGPPTFDAEKQAAGRERQSSRWNIVQPAPPPILTASARLLHESCAMDNEANAIRARPGGVTRPQKSDRVAAQKIPMPPQLSKPPRPYHCGAFSDPTPRFSCGRIAVAFSRDLGLCLDRDIHRLRLDVDHLTVTVQMHLQHCGAVNGRQRQHRITIGPPCDCDATAFRPPPTI